MDKATAAAVLVPGGFACQEVFGTEDFRYRVDGSDVALRMAIEGWHIVIEGPMTLQTAEDIVAEVALQIAEETRTPTEWLQLT